MSDSKRPYVVVDTETTGLDRRTRKPWDIAAVKLEPDTLEEIDRLQFFAAVDLSVADPESLAIGRFYERSPQINPETGEEDKLFYEGFEAWERFVEFTDDCLWVGIQPSFDEHTVFTELSYRGLKGTWHYKIIDAYDVLAGASGLFIDQMRTDDLCQATGVPLPDEGLRHTALGDVLMTASMLRKAFMLGETQA